MDKETAYTAEERTTVRRRRRRRSEREESGGGDEEDETKKKEKEKKKKKKNATARVQLANERERLSTSFTNRVLVDCCGSDTQLPVRESSCVVLSQQHTTVQGQPILRLSYNCDITRAEK